MQVALPSCYEFYWTTAVIVVLYAFGKKTRVVRTDSFFSLIFRNRSLASASQQTLPPGQHKRVSQRQCAHEKHQSGCQPAGRYGKLLIKNLPFSGKASLMEVFFLSPVTKYGGFDRCVPCLWEAKKSRWHQDAVSRSPDHHHTPIIGDRLVVRVTYKGLFWLVGWYGPLLQY